MKQRIVFFGSGAYTIPIVKVLKTRGLKLVVTTEHDGELVQFLKRESIPLIVSDLGKIADIELLKSKQPPLGVLASYGAIIPKKVLDIFPIGILNVHPSLLPKYKGPSPIQATILNGDSETGVTIIKLDEQVDHGSIISQTRMKLTGNETTDELKHELFAKGAEMISELIRMIEGKEELKFTEQDHSKEVFTKKITRESGYIDINTPPDPVTLDRMIRAYYPWPGTWVKYQISNIKYQKEGQEKSKLEGKIIKLLPKQRIQVEGKKVMSYRDFINGYQRPARELLEKLKLLPVS